MRRSAYDQRMPRSARHRQAASDSPRRLHWRGLLIAASVLVGLFLATTDNASIQPLRAVALYQAARWWQAQVGLTPLAGTAVLRGCVRDTTGQPVPGALVLLAEADGTLHTASSGADGCYRVAGVPAGRYVPVVDAAGYETAFVRVWGTALWLTAGAHTRDVTLATAAPRAVQPGTQLHIGAPVALTWAVPQPSAAIRRQITFDSAGQPNQLTFLYTPLAASAPLPTLLAVYPGSADLWEGVSIPLAAAGYAVVAVGPEYALDLERDIAEMQRLLAFVRGGQLPLVDERRIVVLGGSYSSLHVQRLLALEHDLRGAVLLGAASDLFDLRRRFERGSFAPPFGLDQALIALGTPNTAPERYWRYSSRYHARARWPPILLMHSRDDEVVPFEQSQMLADTLARHSVPHEAHVFDGMSHYLLADRPSQQLSRLYDLTTAFLERVTGEPES